MRPPTYRYPDRIQRGYEHFSDHSYIPRFLDQSQHQAAVQLLANISELFREYNIQYIMCHGTLLGSYMFHDVIPWDDDLDIMVSYSDVNRVRRMLRQPEVAAQFGVVSYADDFNLYSQENLAFDADTSRPFGCLKNNDVSTTQSSECVHKFHFYRTDSPKTTLRQIGFPYIDVKFYTENSTNVWPVDMEHDGAMVRRQDFYPLVFRPLFNAWYPAPQNTHYWLKRKFGDFRCSSKWYSHRSQSIAIGYHSKCSSVKSCYPYVQRLPYCTRTPEGRRVESAAASAAVASGDEQYTLEQLRIGKHVIHEAIIKVEFVQEEPLKL